MMDRTAGSDSPESVNGAVASFGFYPKSVYYSFGFCQIFAVYSFGFLQNIDYLYNPKQSIEYGIS
ncbi:MAG: hypothetical protein K2K97_05835, partial [Muribaculaceae bacterium]|nr:hypothetical protein [Muribaculaceae bacterium]